MKLRPAVLAVALGLSACAAPATPSVVTLGDSVPAGSNCGCTPFPALYATTQHATNVNLAVPGTTSADVRAALHTERTPLSSATEVVIMIGANDIADVFDDPSRYATVASGVEQNVTALVAQIRDTRKVPVIVLGYWNVMQDGQVGASNYGPDGVANATRATTLINQALQRAATTAGTTYVSTSEAFHGHDGTDDPTDLLAPDGDHPNAAGQAAIAALIPPLR